MRVMREAGMNSVRLHVWVNHSTGWCNKEDVIAKAKRAAALKLRVMIDFHYSDFFADPSRQNIPVDWADYDLAQMKQAVAEHTTDVLSALKAEGVTPEWVQPVTYRQPMIINSMKILILAITSLLTSWQFTMEQNDHQMPVAEASTWQEVTVPHDWAIYGPFDRPMTCKT